MFIIFKEIKEGVENMNKGQEAMKNVQTYLEKNQINMYK